MAKIIWSPTSLNDVDAIAEYIARDSPEHASLFIERLLEQTDRLADFPLAGRVIKEINDENSREIIYGSYRIMYLITAEEIWITGIVHGARFFAKENGKWVATTLFLALVMVESSDVIFALDSIPAIMAVTRDPFIIFTSNIFAILGIPLAINPNTL